MKFWPIFKVLLAIATLTLLLVFSTGCDGAFTGTGTVYEWKNPSSGEIGQIYIEPDKPIDGLELSPVASAQITFFDRAGVQNPGCVRLSRDFVPNHRLDTATESSGNFKSSNIVSPGHYPMKIAVDMPGYYHLEKEFDFRGDQGNISFTILLIRKP